MKQKNDKILVQRTESGTTHYNIADNPKSNRFGLTEKKVISNQLGRNLLIKNKDILKSLTENSFEGLEKIGEGNDGVVYKVILNLNGVQFPCAIKHIHQETSPLPSYAPDQYKLLEKLKDVEIVRKSGFNIHQYLAVSEEYVLSEFVEGCDVLKLQTEINDGGLVNGEKLSETENISLKFILESIEINASRMAKELQLDSDDIEEGLNLDFTNIYSDLGNSQNLRIPKDKLTKLISLVKKSSIDEIKVIVKRDRNFFNKLVTIMEAGLSDSIKININREFKKSLTFRGYGLFEGTKQVGKYNPETKNFYLFPSESNVAPVEFFSEKLKKAFDDRSSINITLSFENLGYDENEEDFILIDES